MIIFEPRIEKLQSRLFAFFSTGMIIYLLHLLNPLSIFNTRLHDSRDSSVKWIQSFDPLTKDTLRFAQANPTVAPNAPDKTNLVSSRDQQAAQPRKNNFLPESSLPSSEGDSYNLKIANDPNPSSFEDRLSIKSAPREFPKASSNDLPDSFKRKKSAESSSDATLDGKGAKKAKQTEGEKAPKVIFLGDDALNSGQHSTLSPERNHQSASQSRATRPTLPSEMINGPTLRHEGNAPRRGSIAIDCRLHPLGTYLQEMLKSIESQWLRLIENSLDYLREDKNLRTVTYRFTLLKSGFIENLRGDDQNQEYSLSSELCRQAIASTAPFGVWSEEMMLELGESDKVTISFKYQ